MERYAVRLFVVRPGLTKCFRSSNPLSGLAMIAAEAYVLAGRARGKAIRISVIAKYRDEAPPRCMQCCSFRHQSSQAPEAVLDDSRAISLCPALRQLLSPTVQSASVHPSGHSKPSQLSKPASSAWPACSTADSRWCPIHNITLPDHETSRQWCPDCCFEGANMQIFV